MGCGRAGVGVLVWDVHNVYCWAIQADETVKLTYVSYTRATHGLCVCAPVTNISNLKVTLSQT